MRLPRREKTAESLPPTGDEAGDVVTAASKGRPTPKRRDAQGRRGPVTAPKTRKEAYARQKQQAREDKAARRAGTPSTSSGPAKRQSVAEQRAALKRGDTSALPRRDQGKTRKLARDYVDSHRLLSNYLLWIFPLMIIAAFVPKLWFVQFLVIFAFLVLLVEWFVVGRRVRAMSLERFGEAQGGNMSIGFYAGSRAYLPRRWRLPGPQYQRGDEI